MLPPQRSPRRARPRRTRAFLAGREELEIRVVPAVIGPEPMSAMAIAPASEVIEGGSAPITPAGGYGSPVGYTPQEIQAAYGINDIQFGSITGDGAGQTIAIVDAYDDPGFVDSTSPGFSTSDLAEFDQAFGLPNPPSFEKVNQFGSTTDLPGTDPAGAGSSSGNWEYEEAMDVEWAHAIAPAANIILVEADSNSGSDLYDAVAMAADLPGVSTVSMSWGSPEFDGETGLDAFFTTPSGHQGVTFVAATGDGGAPGTYPAYSPNVVAAGGATLTLSSDGTYGSEVGWSGSGGGVSSYETEPGYQDGVQSTGYRTIPDVSFNADFSTGVAFYDSYDNTGGGPWNQGGGTSLAAPSWAALIAIADQGRVAMGGTTLDGASQTLPALYSLPSADFHDITTGYNGNYAAPGYDEVTGIGTPVANLLVPALASYGLSDQLVVTSQPAGTETAGSSFGLTVDVENAGGQLQTGATGTVTLSLASDPGGASLNGTLTATLDDGVATFSGLSIDGAGTGYSLLVTDGGLDSVTSSAFNVVPAAPAQLVIADQPPTSVTAGAGFGLTVDVEDAFGNLETGFGGSVTLSLGTDPTGGSLGGGLKATASGGVADFSGLTIDDAGTGYTIQATGSGLSTATTASFDVTSSTGDQLVVSSEPPQSVTAGAGFGLAVLVEDAYGNLESSYNGDVTVALAGGSGLDGTLSVPATDGVADFSGLTLDQAGSGYSLKATSNGLSAATTAAFAVTPAAPAQLAITSQPPSSITAGAGFGLAVTVEDTYGNAEPSYSGNVTVALAGGTGLDGTLSISASNGVADFSGLTLDQAGAGYSLKATSSGLTAATTAAFAVTPAAPAQLVITTQPPSSITAGAGFGLAVAVEDTYGNAEPGYSGNVTIALTGGTGLDGTLTVPASGGVADFSGLTLDQAGSSDTIHAGASGLSGATTAAFAVTPAAPAQLAIATQPPSSVTAGAGFGLAVSVEDAYGNPEPGYSGNVTIALAGGGSGLDGTLSVPATDGVADFSGLTLNQAGSGYSLKVTSNGLTAATTTTFAVTPAAPDKLAITTQPPSSITAGDNFGLAVSVEDTYGNAEPSYSGNVMVAVTVGAGLDGTLSVPASGGVADFSGLTLDQAGSGYALKVTSNGLTAATTTTFAVTPAAPAQLVITTQPPSSITAGAGFGLAVSVEDAYGNPEPNYSGNVTVALASGSGLNGTLTVSSTDGVADFSGLTLDQAGAGYALKVTSNGLSAATSSFTVTPAAPAQLAITSQPPSSVTAGAGFGLVVSVEDTYGNVEPNDSGDVSVALAGGTGLDGTLSVPATGGLADFSGLTLDQAGAGYTLEVTSNGLSATTSSFAVTAAAPAQLAITTQPPSSVTAGTGFGLAVAVEDAFGNAEPSYSGNVTVALANGANLGGTITVPASNGTADFSGLTLDQAGAGYTLKVTSNGLSGATTTAFAVTPAAPAQLVISSQPPSSITAGAGFGLAVSVEDSYGNAEPSYNGDVTVALTGKTGLDGTLTVPASGGVADFSGLTLDQAGSGYAILASATGLSGATTNPFAVTPAAPARLVITAQPPSSITAGVGFGLSVAVEDAFGNAEPSFNGNVSVALAGGSSGPGLGGLLTIPAGAGVASFSGLTLDRAGSGDTIQVSGIGLTAASTTAFQITPAAASQLVTVAQPPAGLAAGQAFGFTVAVEDPFGNIVTGFGGTVTASMASDPLSGTLTVTANQGLASFSGLTIDQSGAGYALQATAGNLSSSVTGPVSVTPAMATRLVVTAQPPAGVTAGSGFGLTVAAEDAFGNVVTSFQGNVTATLAGGALGGETTVTAVDGVAQFSGLMLDKATSSDTLQLTSGGLSSATTNPLAVTPAAPARWVFIAQPPEKLPARKTFQVVAALEDAFGNVVTDDNGNASVSLTDAPRDARLHGTLTVPVRAGVAVFDGSMSKKLGAGYALSVTGDGLAPATSDAFKVTHPDPAGSVFSAAFRHGRVRVPASRGPAHRAR
jgi:pantothenate kinase type III